MDEFAQGIDAKRRRWMSVSSLITFFSLSAVFTPSGIIGWPETRSRAPAGFRSENPATR
ncbi:MAG TPA: hypothetical protein VL126_11965 [Bacteroidota bacterium]|nr:hypothetical protein [Bacteroidota bacterium]